MVDDQKHLRRAGLLAEHGFHRGAGLGPASLGIRADDYAHVQLVMSGVTILAARVPIYLNHLLPPMAWQHSHTTAGFPTLT